MADSEEAELREVAGEVQDLALQLVDEIQSHRDLAAAERGEFQTQREEASVAELVGQVAAAYAHHEVAADKELRVHSVEGEPVLCTDKVILRRVLGNLVKNALEASAPGQTVSIRFENHGQPIFEVHNESVMPEEVRHQVFQRSFSTKGGRGRGVGTYSVKMLTERYLGGSVAFESVEGQGTTFVVRLPAQDPD